MNKTLVKNYKKHLHQEALWRPIGLKEAILYRFKDLKENGS